jgi:hypothetical protein
VLTAGCKTAGSSPSSVEGRRRQRLPARRCSSGRLVTGIGEGDAAQCPGAPGCACFPPVGLHADEPGDGGAEAARLHGWRRREIGQGAARVRRAGRAAFIGARTPRCPGRARQGRLAAAAMRSSTPALRPGPDGLGGRAVVWTSLGPLPRWVPGPTTRWAPGTTRLTLHGT